MSVSRDLRRRADDRLVTVISGWLARHVSDRELAGELGMARGLTPEQTKAVDELRAELDRQRERAELEMIARETLETLAIAAE
jgi:hypothetical protein